MKATLFFILTLISLDIFSQEKKEVIIKSDVSEVTVFLNGAQVVRKKTVTLEPGTTTLKFVGLSPTLVELSLQAKVSEQVIVLSVNHQLNFVDSIAKPKELEALNNRLQTVNENLKTQHATLDVENEELAFIKDNRVIGGKNQELSLLNYKATSVFYKEQMTAIKMKEIEINNTIDKLTIEKTALEKQINELSPNRKAYMSEVLVKLDAKSQTNCNIELSYYESGASWYPSYDIRAKSITEPIELIYKATITQNTKEDWKNVTLKLSSSNPNLGGVAPVMEPYYLRYPPMYQYVKKNKNFNIGIGSGGERTMSTAAAAPPNMAMAGETKDEESPNVPKQEYVPSVKSDNQTSFEIEIKTPYTIHSDNKQTTVEMDSYSLPADYEYYCVPKLDKDAFLIANIVDWEKYNLLQGEANIFFENTYIGKTTLDVKHISDTLAISLGRDKNVLVKREKMKDFTTKQFIGNKREITKAWQISVKNNKQQAIKMELYDQVPLSTLDEIEVTNDNISGGILNAVKGEVKWKFDLAPAAKKDFELTYKVKYPKDKTLPIE